MNESPGPKMTDGWKMVNFTSLAECTRRAASPSPFDRRYRLGPLPASALRELMCNSRRTPAARQACATLRGNSTWLRRKLWPPDSFRMPTRLMTASQPRIVRNSASSSWMLARTKLTVGRTACARWRAGWRVGMITLRPWAANLATIALPTKPVPPRTQILSCFIVRQSATLMSCMRSVRLRASRPKRQSNTAVPPMTWRT